MNLAVLASHEGTTLQAVLDACAAGRIAARVAAVISNNADSGALRRARAAGVPALHLSAAVARGPDGRPARAAGTASAQGQPGQDVPQRVDRAISDALLEHGVDLVLLAGYMKKLGPLTLAAFAGRVLNTHPALLPKFGGRGMFGRHVHEAVLAAGERRSGATLHLVDAQYDAGAVVAQVSVPVEPQDTPESLAARVQAAERELVVDVLARIAGRFAGGADAPMTGATGRATSAQRVADIVARMAGARATPAAGVTS